MDCLFQTTGPCNEEAEQCRPDPSCQRLGLDTVKLEILSLNQQRNADWQTFRKEALESQRADSDKVGHSHSEPMTTFRTTLHKFRGAKEKDDTPKSLTLPVFQSPQPVSINTGKAARKSSPKPISLPGLERKRNKSGGGPRSQKLIVNKSSGHTATRDKSKVKEREAKKWASQSSPSSYKKKASKSGSSGKNKSSSRKRSAKKSYSRGRSKSRGSQKSKKQRTSSKRSSSKGMSSSGRSKSRGKSRSRKTRSSSREKSRGRSKRRSTGRRKPRGPPPTPISHDGHKFQSQKIAKLEKFNKSRFDAESDDLPMSRVNELRGYSSEPEDIMSIPCELKFDLKKRQQATRSWIKSKSMNDLYLDVQVGYDQLMTTSVCYDEKDLKEVVFGQQVWKKWQDLFQMEKRRFSFFDELFARKCVTDSMEVPRFAQDISYLIEADDEQYCRAQGDVNYGRVVLKTKHIYTGNLVDWYFQGPGRYTWIEGPVYQGDFVHGVMHGDGTLLWPDGSIYEGQFRNGVRSGWGTYSTSEGYTYSGDWVQGLPEGRGKAWYDPDNNPGNFYDGEFSQGFSNGFGTRQYTNGDHYVGNWLLGQRDGEGTMLWREQRQMYKGQWKAGLPHGSGIHMWYVMGQSSSGLDSNNNDKIVSTSSRHIFKGDYQNGVRHGVGKIMYPTGAVYKGKWENGKQIEGQGQYMDPAQELIGSLVGADVGGTLQTNQIDRPIYECIFRKLIDTIHPLKANNESMVTEEHELTNICLKYLNELQLLYKRVGDLGEKWSNHTPHPKWTKSGSRKTCFSQYDPLKMNYENFQKIFSIHNKLEQDSSNPVTRLGLWLLIKDCPRLLTDVTMAHYDKKWGSTASICFRTAHNPYEPVYFWQFLQCLIITALEVYVEIPAQQMKIQYRSKSVAKENAPNLMEGQADAEQLVVTNNNNNHPKTGKSFSKSETGKKFTRHSSSTVPKVQATTKKGSKNISSKNNKKKATTTAKGKEKKRSSGQKNINSVENIKNALHVDDPSVDDFIDIPKDDDGALGRAPSLIIEEDNGESDPAQSLLLQQTESSESDIFVQGEQSDFKSTLSVADIFERLIIQVLLPCFSRCAGKLLPPLPNSLPPLVDLFGAFKSIKNEQGVITAVDFLRSAFPSAHDSVYWTRSKQSGKILSLSVNYDQLLDIVRPTESKIVLNHKEENMTDTFPNEQQGTRTSDSQKTMEKVLPQDAKQVLVQPTDDLEQKKKIDNEERIPYIDIESMSDQNPQDHRQIEQKVEIKGMKLWSNLEVDDVVTVLRYMYPNVCGIPGETNLQFEMIFCDWLWCVSLCFDKEREKKVKCSSSTYTRNVVERKSTEHSFQCHYRASPQKFRNHHQQIQRGEMYSATVQYQHSRSVQGHMSSTIEQWTWPL